MADIMHFAYHPLKCYVLGDYHDSWLSSGSHGRWMELLCFWLFD